MKAKGIDVSYAQSKVDWNKVKEEGIEFAFIRIGYGRELKQKDAQFEANYQGAKAVSIPLGGYHYSYAVDNEGAMREAKACLAMIGDKKFDLPIAYDMEESKQFALSPEKLYSMYKTFAGILESEGHACMLYTNKNWMVNKWDKTDLAKDGGKVWMAQYNSSMTYTGPSNILIWQNSSSGAVGGINGRVDTNVALVDLEELKAVKNGWINENGHWWFRHADGSYPKNSWKQIEGKWYYFGNEGWLHTGWLELEGKWYYLKPDGAMAKNEVLTIKSDTHGAELYAFGEDGHMLLQENDRGALI